MSADDLRYKINRLEQELERVKGSSNRERIEFQQEIKNRDILINRMKDQIIDLELQINHLKQQIKASECYANERSHALHHKNIQIARLEQDKTNLINHRISQLQEKNATLQHVIAHQAQEIETYLNDHELYLGEFQKLQDSYNYLMNQRHLLYQFTHELRGQIEVTEKNGTHLQNWIANYHEELTAQNEQSSDLLGQIQNMISVLEMAR